MVLQNGFLLQLINAETRLPLNEYTGPTGQVSYAEAKPDGEYFLRFQVLEKGGNEERQDQGDTVYYFRPSVDGKDLGFYTNLTSGNGARDVGLWTYENGVGTNKALKFETATEPMDEAAVTEAAGTETAPSVKEEVSSKQQSPPMLSMGNVQVQISEAIFTGHQKREYYVPPLTESETVVAPAVSVSASSSLHEDELAPQEQRLATEGQQQQQQQDPVPVLRTREGAMTFQDKYTEECPTYKPGKLLETITIHYGSTAALIQAGVLVPIMAGFVPPYVEGAPITTAPISGLATEATNETSSAPPSEPPAADIALTPAPVAVAPKTANATAPKPLSGLVPNPLVSVSSMHPPPSTGLKRPPNSSENEGSKPPAKKTCVMELKSTGGNQKRTIVSTK